MLRKQKKKKKKKKRKEKKRKTKERKSSIFKIPREINTVKI